MNRKILGFDSWTEGYRHYERLVGPLKEVGYDLKLVHFGSLGHDVGRPKSEKLGDLEVCDFTAYEGLGIREILRQESPAAVVFLSTESFLHRAVNRYCISQSIPTLHLYHGLISVQAVETGQPDKYRFSAQARIVLQRSAKNLLKILPVYLASLLRTRAGLSDWSHLTANIVSKVFGRYVAVAAPDASTTMCAVYAKSDVAHAHTKYRIPIDQIRVVGNPDLIKFGVRPEDVLCCAVAPRSGGHVVYLDHGGSTSGFTFGSEAEFVDFLLATRSATDTAGCRLLVKLHPAQYLTEVPTVLRAQGFDLIEDTAFLPALQEARAVICGPTTVSIIPGLLGLPIILAHYGQFNTQEYGTVLKEYPRARLASSLGELAEIVRNPPDANMGLLRQWVDEHVSPLPASDMPHRVVGAITDMVRQ